MIWILYRQTLRHSAVKQKNLLEQLQSRNERMFPCYCSCDEYGG